MTQFKTGFVCLLVILYLVAGLANLSANEERPKEFIGQFKFTEMFNNSFLTGLVNNETGSLLFSLGSNGRANIENLKDPFRWFMKDSTLTFENNLLKLIFIIKSYTPTMHVCILSGWDYKSNSKIQGSIAIMEKMP